MLPHVIRWMLKHQTYAQLEEKMGVEKRRCLSLIIRKANVFPETTSLSRLIFMSYFSLLGHLLASASFNKDWKSGGEACHVWF